MTSPTDTMQAMIDNLPDNTGRNLDQWLEVGAKSGLNRHGQIVSHLKAEHRVTHGYASLIATRALNQPADSQDLVATQYQGPKEALHSIYQAVLNTVEGFGDDVEVSPKKTYVGLRRSKQFAMVKASTRTRVDLGLNLPGVKGTDRLKETTGMCTHTVALATPEDLDSQAVTWLEAAYKQA